MESSNSKVELIFDAVSSPASALGDAGPVEIDCSWMEQVVRLEQSCFDQAWSEDLIRQELESDSSLAMGLLLDGYGLIAYSLNRIVADELHVLRIGVEHSWRGKGVAHTLMSYVLEAAKRKGAQLGLLECRASNSSAQRLYRGLGFQIEGSRRGYYRDNGEDALLLSLDMTDTKAKTLAVLKHRAV